MYFVSVCRCLLLCLHLTYIFFFDYVFFIVINLLCGMFLILGILIAIVGFYFLCFHYDFIRAFLLTLQMDGPPAYPIIGNGLLFFNKNAAGIFFNCNCKLECGFLIQICQIKCFVLLYLWNRKFCSCSWIIERIWWLLENVGRYRNEHYCTTPKRCWSWLSLFIQYFTRNQID